MLKVTINGVQKQWPISSEFGQIDSAHWLPHKGIDFAIPQNTPVPSVGEGTVTQVADMGTKGFGKFIKVHLNNGADVIYGHLNDWNVKVGDIVHKGQTIAVSGSTGESTGPHLHLQVMNHGFVMDPTSYAQGVGMIPGIGDKIVDAALDKIGDVLHSFLILLNNNSSEIVTFWLVICGGMMMIAPLIGKSAGKWFGRAVGGLWLGAIWRLLI